MKKINAIFLTLSICLMAVSSCQKVEDSVKTTGSFLSVKVNGTLKEAKGDTKVVANYIQSEKNLQIIGNFDNINGVNISLENPAVGDFDISKIDNMIVSYFNTQNPLASVLAETGFVKITSFTDNVVKGTFQATGIDNEGKPVTLSEGAFEAKLYKM